MTDIINEFFRLHYPKPVDPSKFEFNSILGGMNEYTDRSVSRIFPAIHCADGFHMSVQGHAGAYSSPRDDFAHHYSEVEVGFPSEREELLIEFAENPDDPTETVYGYVPIGTVIEVIEKHGGINSDKYAALTEAKGGY